MSYYYYLPLHEGRESKLKLITEYGKSINKKIIEADSSECQKHWTETAFNLVIHDLKRLDHLIVYEASDIACSINQILEIMTIASKRGISFHFIKYKLTIDNTKSEINTCHLLDTISKIESDFISKRTFLALARRKAAGFPIGRPPGRKNSSLKLDKFKEDIDKYLTLGISKASISRLIQCHPQTLHDWLKRNALNVLNYR